MTSVETVSQLRENPFEIAREQLRRVAVAFDIDPNLVNVLQECKKAVVVSIPVSMDDGTIRHRGATADGAGRLSERSHRTHGRTG